MSYLLRTTLVLAVVALLLCATVLAAVPAQLSYQGFLADAAGDPVADGPHLIQFRIWDAESGGTALWDSNYRTINTTDGLFSYNLGDTVALDPAICQTNSDLWVGVKVGTDPELSPRTKLTSVAYAMSADHAGFADSIDWTSADASYVNTTGDVMTGNLAAPGLGLGTASTAHGILQIYSSLSIAPVVVAGVSGALGGYIQTRATSGDVMTGMASSSSGGYIWANRNSDEDLGFWVAGNYNNTQEPFVALWGSTQSINFNLSETGNSSVLLPNDAIGSDEILNEPGIAFQRNEDIVIFTQGFPSMTDIETVSITIPAPGYIVVKAELEATTVGTTGNNYGITQIDETSGGGEQFGHRHTWGQESGADAITRIVPHTRIYYKSAGTYSFRVEGKAYASNGAGAVTATSRVWILATYYPTSYGTVETIVASPDGFDNAEAVSVEDLDGNTTTAYKVDLRDLELRATRARLEAERQQREAVQTLIKAQQLEQELTNARQESSN